MRGCCWGYADSAASVIPRVPPPGARVRDSRPEGRDSPAGRSVEPPLQRASRLREEVWCSRRCQSRGPMPGGVGSAGQQPRKVRPDHEVGHVGLPHRQEPCAQRGAPAETAVRLARGRLPDEGPVTGAGGRWFHVFRSDVPGWTVDNNDAPQTACRYASEVPSTIARLLQSTNTVQLLIGASQLGKRAYSCRA